MFMHAARGFALYLTLTCALAAQGGLTPEQGLTLRYVLGVYASPDGSHGCYTLVTPRGPGEAPGGARLSLHALPQDGTSTEGIRLLGSDITPRGVSYSPDSAWLTFVAKRADAPHPEVYGLPLSGGEAQRITTTPHGVSSYHWSPDGQSIAFTALDPMPKARAQAQAKGFKPVIHDEDYRSISLWVWDRKSGKSRQITRDVSVYDFAFAPDSQRLAAAIAPRNLTDDSYMMKRIHLVDLKTDTVKKLVDNPGKLGSMSWSPDGKELAYISAADRRDPHAGSLFVYSLDGGSNRSLLSQFRGMFHTVEWEGANSLRCCVSVGVNTRLMVIGKDSGKFEWRPGGENIAFRSHVTQGERYLVAASTPSHPAEVYAIEKATGTTARLTDHNPDLAEVALGKQEVMTFKARDGLEIEGLLLHPVGHDGTTRAPLVIVAHGGPESHFSNGWITRYSEWGQMLAARGYFVWYPNYRASTGYGVEFAKADHGDPMGGEFEDHLDAIAHLDERGLIDRKRVGLGGGSYGGYTAAWAATRHSEHFAAAVSFVPFVDIRTKWLTSDIPIEFYRVHYEEKWPHEQAEFLAMRSPLSYAQDCKTPLLLLGGDADPRVHPSQPHMLYRAVKFATETPVRYVKYTGEGHGNRISTNRVDYCLRAMRWFDHYLAEGAQRTKALPPIDVDYGVWAK
jgi:dipeptidyl aminopeptidase/acylaminoacyl peptidase